MLPAMALGSFLPPLASGPPGVPGSRLHRPTWASILTWPPPPCLFLPCILHQDMSGVRAHAGCMGCPPVEPLSMPAETTICAIPQGWALSSRHHLCVPVPPARCTGQVPCPVSRLCQLSSGPWAPSPRTTLVGGSCGQEGVGLLDCIELHMLGVNMVLILNPEGHLG